MFSCGAVRSPESPSALRAAFRRVVSAASDAIRPFQMALMEVVLLDDALPVADQVVEQVEYLWRDGDDDPPRDAARAGQCRMRTPRRDSAICQPLRRPPIVGASSTAGTQRIAPPVGKMPAAMSERARSMPWHPRVETTPGAFRMNDLVRQDSGTVGRMDPARL